MSERIVWLVYRGHWAETRLLHVFASEDLAAAYIAAHGAPEDVWAQPFSVLQVAAPTIDNFDTDGIPEDIRAALDAADAVEE